MRLLLLTTETVHHFWFVKELIKKHPNIEVIVVKNKKNSFDGCSLFDVKQQEYETSCLIDITDTSIESIAPTKYAESVNDPVVGKVIKKIDPSLIIVFGTDRITESIYKGYDKKIVNLHGGDPELYRGLDSHFWSVYHNDYQRIVTCIHYISGCLDAGDIIMKAKIDLRDIDYFYQVRLENTKVCLQLVIMVITMLEQFGHILSYKQKFIGQYYSRMPNELRKLCCKKFEKFMFKGIHEKIS